MFYNLPRHEKQIVQPVFSGIGAVRVLQPFQCPGAGVGCRKIIGKAAGFFHVYDLAAADIGVQHLRVVCGVGEPQHTSPGMAQQKKLFLMKAAGEKHDQGVKILQKRVDCDDAVPKIVIGLSGSALFPYSHREMAFQLTVIF